MNGKKISVEKAITIGIWLINIPCYIILIGLMLFSILLIMLNLIHPIWFMLCFILSILIPIFYWSYAVTKWRLWAFENVRNVHELKKRAIQEKIIREDDSFYEKIEIRNYTEKEKWKLLQKKFLIDDIFKDDLNVPKETEIFYSKNKNYLYLFFFIICLVIPICLIVENSYVYGSISLLAIVYLIYGNIKNLINKSPQIIINIKGIETPQNGLHLWQNIEGEEVTKIGKSNYLIYLHQESHIQIDIEELNISARELNKINIIYRNRKVTTANSGLA